MDGQRSDKGSAGESLREAKIVESFENSGGHVVWASRNPVELVSLDQSQKLSLDSLRGRRVGLLSGVARPASVRRTFESLGADVVEERRFRDHYEYTQKDCLNLDHSTLMWVTTEKDALKILPQWLGNDTLWILRIEVEMNEEEIVLDRLEAHLRATGRLAGQPTRQRDPVALDPDFTVEEVL